MKYMKPNILITAFFFLIILSCKKKEYITFTDSASTLLFGGVCNSGIGIFFIESNKFNIDSLVTTKRLCIYFIWENYLKNNLDSAYEYKITGNNLTIYSMGAYNLNFVVQ